MRKEFIPYEQALALKELGFDEPCLSFREKDNDELFTFHSDSYQKVTGFFCLENQINAPTFSQAFRWFREKYNLCIVIKPIDAKKLELGYNLTKNGLIMGAYTTYEKAELACLKKLIEIVKQ